MLNNLLQADFHLHDIELDGCSADPKVFETKVKEPVIVKEDNDTRVKRQIVWHNVIWYSVLHIGAVYGFYILPTALPLTLMWGFFLYILGGLGITAGAHRLWSHRTYKAKLPTRIMLAVWQTLAFQNSIIDWCRDHRVHHKFSETDADPHNATRGLFFSHMGWLLVRKHPDVKTKGSNLDMADLHADPVCYYQRKFYKPLLLLIFLVIPVGVPTYLWQESYLVAYFVCVVLRYVCNLHCTWFVNSVAHILGNKPYDGSINPTENLLVTVGAMGEGFHNYHHTFPYDYSTSEYGWRFNVTTLLIDTLAAVGQVTDRKKVSREVVRKRAARTGDGSRGFVLGRMFTHTHAD